MPLQEMLTREHREKPSFQLIKQDDNKFFSKLLSKEIPDSSFRVYDESDGHPGSVPFFWESQPGTPKHRLNDITVPPLTPPPSYHSKSSNGKRSSGSSKKLLSSTSNLLRIIFLKARGKKSSCVEVPAGSLHRAPLDEDHDLVFPSSLTDNFGEKLHEPRRFSSRGSSSSSDSSWNDGGHGTDGLSTSAPCFGTMRPIISNGGQTGTVWPRQYRRAR